MHVHLHVHVWDWKCSLHWNSPWIHSIIKIKGYLSMSLLLYSVYRASPMKVYSIFWDVVQCSVVLCPKGLFPGGDGVSWNFISHQQLCLCACMCMYICIRMYLHIDDYHVCRWILHTSSFAKSSLSSLSSCMMSTSRLVCSRLVTLCETLTVLWSLTCLRTTCLFCLQEVRFFREHNHELDQRVS